MSEEQDEIISSNHDLFYCLIHFLLVCLFFCFCFLFCLVVNRISDLLSIRLSCYLELGNKNLVCAHLFKISFFLDFLSFSYFD